MPDRPVAPPCATYAEYRRVRNGQTPIKVQSIFGVPGRRVAWHHSHGVWTYVYRYPPCAGQPKGAPYVWFRGWQGHPSAVIDKHWLR